VLKDDYSAVFGKALLQDRRRRSYNQKNEDVFDWGSGECRSSGMRQG